MARFFLLVVACLLAMALPVCAANVRLAIPEWSPFSSADMPNNGFMTDLVVSAFTESGNTVSVTVLPWKRALLKGEKGEVDAVLGASYVKEREVAFIYSRWSYSVEPYFFCGAESKDYDGSVDALCPATVGVFRGSGFLKSLAGSCLTIEEGNDHEQNLKKLCSKRLDYALTQPEVVLHMMRKGELSFSQLRACGKPYAQDAAHVVFSRNSAKAQQFVKAFDEGMLKLQQSGAYDAILKKHGVDKVALKALGVHKH